MSSSEDSYTKSASILQSKYSMYYIYKLQGVTTL